jgi:hypothetical protein
LILFHVFIFCVAFHNSYSQKKKSVKTPDVDSFVAQPVDIVQRLKIFDNGVKNADYRITLCANVPNDKRPMELTFNQQTGHVFLILQKISGKDTLNDVFGFYPKKGFPVLIFKTAKPQIKDNSRRDYDVEISKKVTSAEFDTVLFKAVFYSRHKYHINKFNCYDYALDVFNSIAGAYPLPVNRIKYPFIFGKGGSPVCLYWDLKTLKETNSVWAPNIRFGSFFAPVSTGRKLGH